MNVRIPHEPVNSLFREEKAGDILQNIIQEIESLHGFIKRDPFAHGRKSMSLLSERPKSLSISQNLSARSSAGAHPRPSVESRRGIQFLKYRYRHLGIECRASTLLQKIPVRPFSNGYFLLRAYLESSSGTSERRAGVQFLSRQLFEFFTHC